eukprot:jgi/Ulvmu1/9728/UM055_0068.1
MPADSGQKMPLRLPRAACLPLLAMLLLAGIPLGIIAFTEVEPRKRPIFPFDATVMDPNTKSAISAIDFLLPGFFFSFIMLAVTEFFLMHPQLPRQLQIDNYTQALVHMLAGFLAHICIQQLSSVLAGKPRPNFLSVCKPSVTVSAAITSADVGTEDTAGSITTDDCTDGRDMSDYLRSFPSGHASAAMFLTVYPVAYMLHTLLVRRDVGRSCKESRFIWEARMALMTCFNAFVFALAWYVGLSRYIDNKHHIEDIVAGYLLGLVFAVWAAVECFITQRSIAARYAEEMRAVLGNNGSSELCALGQPEVSLGMPPHRS